MIKFPNRKNINEIKKYFKNFGLEKIFQNDKFNQKTYKPNLKDLYRIHSFIIKNKRVCGLEYGTGWSSLVIWHALQQNKKKYKIDNKLRFAKPFSLTVLDNSKKYINIAKKNFSSFFNTKKNINFCFSEVNMVKYNFKYATEYKKHPLINPDFIYLDGPDQTRVKSRINNFTVNHNTMMPMACDILKYEHFLTPGTLIICDGRTANARFLKSNFQRNWLYSHDLQNDQSIFFLN